MEFALKLDNQRTHKTGRGQSQSLPHILGGFERKKNETFLKDNMKSELWRAINLTS